MRSKLWLLLPLAFSSACTVTGGNTNSTPGDGMIGKPIKAVTEMSDPNSADRSQIVMFDRTVRLVHQFDLATMSVVKTLTVDSPSENHSVLFDQNTGLIADFSAGHMTLFDRASNRVKDPVTMLGKARSFAYDPAHRSLVLYDDVNTVGLLKLDTNGAPVQSWAGGPLLQADDVLTAGDLIDDGSLILALSSGVIARVNVDQSIAQRRWVFTSVTTTLDRITWIAPVHGFNDRVLVKTATAVALVSLTNGATIASKTFETYGNAVFDSKTRDAHIIAQSPTSLTVFYTDGTTVRALPLNATPELILSSRLSISEDSWSLVTSKVATSWTYEKNPVETEGKDRLLIKYRLSDLYSVARLPLPDKAQLDVSENYVFALYPVPLGYGERLGINDDSHAVIKMFNMGHIK